MEEDAGEGGLEEAQWGTIQKTEEGVDDVGVGAEGEREEGVEAEGVKAEGEDGERDVEEEVGVEGAEGEGPYLQSFFVLCSKVEPQRWGTEAELPCTPPLRTTSLLMHDCLHSTPAEIHGQSLGYFLQS